MARWAIGDIQGCFRTFSALLDQISYRSERDELWIAGDLVNRGAGSAATVDWIRRHPIKVVLGNHDLHALAVLLGQAKPKRKDTLGGLINHPHKPAVIEWLLAQPLTINADYWMSHAGLYPKWTFAQASGLAKDAQQFYRQQPETFFSQMYGNEPNCWQESLEDIDRHRFVVNALTRMRWIDEAGNLDMSHKGPLNQAPAGLKPWFKLGDRSKSILFGHWAALNTPIPAPGVIALDSGCVWGQHLSAFNLDTQQWVQQPADPKDLIYV